MSLVLSNEEIVSDNSEMHHIVNSIIPTSNWNVFNKEDSDKFDIDALKYGKFY